MVSLDHVGTLLSNHVDRVLDAAVRDDGHDGSIDNTEVLDAVDLELGIIDSSGSPEPGEGSPLYGVCTPKT